MQETSEIENVEISAKWWHSVMRLREIDGHNNDVNGSKSNRPRREELG